MSGLFPEKPVHYCYLCGNRLRPNMEACWYCGAPTHREIRPVRQCPFCAEPVRREAIKCRHCGEFLDDRPRPEQQQPVRQMIVIDKDLLKAMSDLRLFPGLPVPDAARQVLEARTVRAIEDNTPEQIEQPGVEVLPAPSGAPILLEYKPGGKEVVRRVPPPPPAKPIPPPPKVPPPPAITEKPEGIVDAELADIYRICAQCRTEILADDNFCYHCGTQYRRTQRDKYREKKARRRRFREVVKLFVTLCFIGLLVLVAYLYFRGLLTRENIQSTQQTVIEGVKGTVAKGVEELKDLDPKAIVAARECRKNLKLIESAKRAVAEREGQVAGTIPLEDVLKELKMDELPACPSAGIYSLNTLEQPTTCSIGTNNTTARLDDHIIGDR